MHVDAFKEKYRSIKSYTTEFIEHAETVIEYTTAKTFKNALFIKIANFDPIDHQ